VVRKRYSLVTRQLWSDARFIGLSAAGPCGQVLWLYLLTGEHQGPIPGLMRTGRGALADGLGWDLADLERYLDELEGAGLLQRSKRPPLLWLPNALRHNPPQSPNVVKSWAAVAVELPECGLRDTALLTMRRHLAGPFLAAFDDQVLPAVGLEPPGKASGKPTGKASGKASGKICPNQEQEQEQEEPHPPGGGSGEAALWLARYLQKCIRSHSPKARTNVDAWQADIERLVRIDGADPDLVRQVIQWAHCTDPGGFWRPNLLSGGKLRKQWDSLLLRAEKAGKVHRRAATPEAWLKQHVAWLRRWGDRYPGEVLDPAALVAAARADEIHTPKHMAPDLVRWLKERR